MKLAPHKQRGGTVIDRAEKFKVNHRACTRPSRNVRRVASSWSNEGEVRGIGEVCEGVLLSFSGRRLAVALRRLAQSPLSRNGASAH